MPKNWSLRSRLISKLAICLCAEAIAEEFNFNLKMFLLKFCSLSVILFTIGGRLDFKTFWLLVLTYLSLQCKISSSYLVPVPNYWTKTTCRKKRFSWSNPSRIEVMINVLIEMLQLPNFSHMTASII